MSIIFPDTVYPKNLNEIFTKVLHHPNHETIDSYRKLAERTLVKAGYPIDLDDPTFVERLTSDRKLPFEIWEASSILSSVGPLKILNDLIETILGASTAIGARADGFQNIRVLIDVTQRINRDITRWGERIKGRKSERLARIGQTKVKGAKALARSAVKTIPLWDRALLALLKLHRSWSDRHIVREALKNPPAEVRLGTFGHGSYGSLRKRVAVLRSQHSLLRINPPQKIIGSMR